MTNLEMEELSKVLQIDSLKESNSYKVGKLVYTHKNDKVIVTGNIPVTVIQELSMLPDVKTCYLKQLLSLNKKDGEFFKKIEINTIEEFVLLFQYMEDYAVSKMGLIGNSCDLCDEIIEETYRNILNKVDLRMSNEEWIRKKHYFDGVYEDYIKRLNKKPFFKKEKAMMEYDYNLNIRKNIDNFDSYVNPYLNNSVNLKKINKLGDKLTISIDKPSNDGVIIKVVDNDTNNYVIYERNDTSFYYEVGYDFKGQFTSFRHAFELNNVKCDKVGPGERIVISEKDHKTYFNITTNQIVIDKGSLMPITLEQKKKIYDEILTASAYSEDITRNMFKEKNFIKK